MKLKIMMIKEALYSKDHIVKIPIAITILFCIILPISAAEALAIGFFFSMFFKNPMEAYTQKGIKILLQVSIIGLGFGMNVTQALKAGKEGLLFTISSIAITLSLGLLLARWLKVEKLAGYLIAIGTAICGGSAIAATAPILNADAKVLSVSLGTVFILNSVALVLFPWIGHLLHLSQNQFGLWAAIAIHDTSSVVGAAAKFGQTALHIATTIKLERALWIIPVSLLCVVKFKTENANNSSNESKGKIKLPYFMVGFLLAMLMNSYLPVLSPIYKMVQPLAQKCLILTLFFIGTSLSVPLIKSVGVRPLLQGILLWSFISVVSLSVIIHFVK